MATPVARRSKLRVLIAADAEEVDPELLKRLGSDWLIERISDPEAALEALGSGRFDLVLAPAALLESWRSAPTGKPAARSQPLEAIDAAGRELVSLDPKLLVEMDVGERLTWLEERVLRYCHELLHYDHFMLRVLDPQSGKLETLLASGVPEEAAELEIYARKQGGGISGYVAVTGRTYICPDVTRDPRYLPGMPGARSSLTVPLSLHDRVIGVLNVESEQPAAFSEQDARIAQIFAHYVAIALHILQLLAVERQTTTDQLAADVDAELADPLNDIVSDASKLIEQHRGDETLVRRLQEIIDDVDRVKHALHSVTMPRGVSGLLPRARQHDPLLEGRRILIADDEDIIRQTIADVLGKLGALTVMAADGIEATAMIRSQHFDLVLSDIKMPHCTGYDVFRVVRETHPDCPVILITGFGYDPNHSIIKASREGLAGVLFKPFKVEQMLDEVRRALTSACK